MEPFSQRFASLVYWNKYFLLFLAFHSQAFLTKSNFFALYACVCVCISCPYGLIRFAGRLIFHLSSVVLIRLFFPFTRSDLLQWKRTHTTEVILVRTEATVTAAGNHRCFVCIHSQIKPLPFHLLSLRSSLRYVVFVCVTQVDCFGNTLIISYFYIVSTQLARTRPTSGQTAFSLLLVFSLMNTCDSIWIDNCLASIVSAGTNLSSSFSSLPFISFHPLLLVDWLVLFQNRLLTTNSQHVSNTCLSFILPPILHVINSVY